MLIIGVQWGWDGSNIVDFEGLGSKSGFDCRPIAAQHRVAQGPCSHSVEPVSAPATSQLTESVVYDIMMCGISMVLPSRSMRISSGRA